VFLRVQVFNIRHPPTSTRRITVVTPQGNTGVTATAEALVRLGRLALDFGRVDRIALHPDGRTAESDTDHTVMLGLIACAFAHQHRPALDTGRIAQYALVHDLVEVYAGDTPTLRALSATAKSEKQRREHQAQQRILAEFGGALPWLPETIADYERRATPEARYVKALDKLMPKIAHILNRGATFRQERMSVADVAARYESQIGELKEYAADFPELFELRGVLVDQLLAELHEPTPAPRRRSYSCRVCDAYGTWRLARPGEIVTRWACTPHLGEVADAMQRELDVTELTVVHLPKLREWQELTRMLGGG
jgi:putative hydrolase of HD superfamily